MDDNIKILENCEKSILLLPLRLLSQTDKTDTIITWGEKVFISLFDNIETIENYFEKCNTLSDIMSYAKTDMEKWVVFSEYDDKSLSFEKRFERTLEYNADIIGHCKSDAEAFYVIIYGHIQQAVDVIASCLEYNCIPFVRYSVALNYILLLIESLNEQCSLKKYAF